MRIAACILLARALRCVRGRLHAGGWDTHHAAYGGTRTPRCHRQALSRVDSECIVSYLTLAKSGISQIYYVKSGIWPERPSVQYDI
jgi:hypothetical protein